jgi:hypothetical protein
VDFFRSGRFIVAASYEIQNALALFLEITPASMSGVLSGLISAIVWLIMATGLMSDHRT